MAFFSSPQAKAYFNQLKSHKVCVIVKSARDNSIHTFSLGLDLFEAQDIIKQELEELLRDCGDTFADISRRTSAVSDVSDIGDNNAPLGPVGGGGGEINDRVLGGDEAQGGGDAAQPQGGGHDAQGWEDDGQAGDVRDGDGGGDIQRHESVGDGHEETTVGAEPGHDVAADQDDGNCHDDQNAPITLRKVNLCAFIIEMNKHKIENISTHFDRKFQP